MLRKNKESFDIVITDVVGDDMDGFKLLEAIGLEMDIPIIMTSANDSQWSERQAGGIKFIIVSQKKNKNSLLQDEDEETSTDQSRGESCPPRKKNRMRWSKELHHKFLDAYYQLEVDNLDKVVPKRILEIMNEPGITREKVASHLQKFRNDLKKQTAIVNQDSIISTTCKSSNMSFTGHVTKPEISNMLANQKPYLMPRNAHEQI
ncbi:hypothetical protein K7X08_019431 [Anisodus acutangulus]|uniref:Response regulatory domain-containing protein n=1 Tax=Anisodus acutangulus TaxID=402998 RepID=A0A9Q1RLZ8_9SOLA|nr:hypothetical protein K7X08_019431 [Anisodus acutangulus]